MLSGWEGNRRPDGKYPCHILHWVYDYVTCRLTASDRDQPRTQCSIYEYGLPLPFTHK